VHTFLAYVILLLFWSKFHCWSLKPNNSLYCFDKLRSWQRSLNSFWFIICGSEISKLEASAAKGKNSSFCLLPVTSAKVKDTHFEGGSGTGKCEVWPSGRVTEEIIYIHIYIRIFNAIFSFYRKSQRLLNRSSNR